jgi:photosystem II stability/assembly factor-like uncharacterized protein
MLVAQVAFAQTWVTQQSGTTASLRGVSAVSDGVVWASGSGGTWLRTTDGGATWHAAIVVGAEALDFRGVQALDETTAWLLSSGPGDKSRIYKTTDAGGHWTLQYTNPDAKGFFDAIAFWNPVHGVVVGDPVDGQFAILTTSDGGTTWKRQSTPAALANEGAFAASNTCLRVNGNRLAWFGTGGPGAARVFRSQDGGLSWSVASTPMRNDGASAGIFSIAFSDARHGVAVGGDYAKPVEATSNMAITADGGSAWTASTGPGPNGFRSAVVYVAGHRAWIATGTNGSDVSVDNGKNWRQFDSEAYNALSTASRGATWAVGPKGRIARLQWP